MDIIDWSLVNWADVGVYAAIAFLSSLIAFLLNRAFGDSAILAAILTTILFSVAYLGWNYYPHGIDVGQSRPTGGAVAPASTPAAPSPTGDPTAEPAPKQ